MGAASQLSRKEAIDPISRALAHVTDAIVKAAQLTVPELDELGGHAVSAPEGWTRNGTAGKARGELGDARVELGARRERPALERRPGSDLALARPARKVRVRLGIGDANDGAFDPH